MYIDTHCHLFFDEYNTDREMVIGNAKKAGVKQFIVPGVDAYSSKQAVDLALQHPGIIFPSIGFHPYEAAKDPDIHAIELLLKPQVVAIGECGLDYHMYKGEEAKGKKDRQKYVFAEHLRLALTHNFPVIMHCRDAYEDFFSVLDSMPKMPRGVIHCFSGGVQELRMAEERKLFVGIDGNSTFSKQLQMIIPSIPLSMILLETDSPYLTPIPHRGTRNEPKYIPLIAQLVASVHNREISDVEQQTTINAHTLFSRIL